MRNQYLLIRRLGLILRSRMSKSGHLLQAVTQESRGNCLPPRAGCGPACQEANELLVLTEPYMRETRDLPKPLKPLRPIALKRPTRRVKVVQPDLFGEAS